MKLTKYIYAILLLSLSFAGCVENNPLYEDFPDDKVAFSYSVDGNYKIDYLVGSTIQFNNISEAIGSSSWDFGDGSGIVTESNPKHVFQTAGTYNVTLSVEGEGQVTKKILISDIFPTITIDPIEGGLCEVNKVTVHFSVALPNPQNLPVDFTWVLPEGTIDANGKEITEYRGADPGQLKFKNIGSQKIVLKTTLGGRSLEEGVVNVPVGYTEPAKTIYYAVKGGNLMALKLIPNMPAGMKNRPFDLGLKSGQHPMNLLFSDSCLYVLDAGKQFIYIDDRDAVLGDGSISVVAYDGSKVETLLTNKKEAFNDPFYGFIDDNDLYFSDRNTGITKVPKTSRNMAMDRKDSRFNYFVQNDRLKYYNAGYGYGTMNACMAKVDDTWWWAKTTAGTTGLFRFKAEDISATAISAGEKDKPYPVLGSGFYIKSFVIDKPHNMIYYAVRDKGFYKATLDEFMNSSNKTPGTLVLPALISDGEGSVSEYIDICQMVLDSDDGSVYFGYRKDPSSPVASGLKRYNPATNTIESIIDNVEIYGVAINHTKAKLF